MKTIIIIEDIEGNKKADVRVMKFLHVSEIGQAIPQTPAALLADQLEAHIQTLTARSFDTKAVPEGVAEAAAHLCH